MVLVFDLDDTLYDEMDFVRGGLRAVAHYGQVTFGLRASKSYSELLELLTTHGRGKVFDLWLSRHDRYAKTRVRECVRVYRQHEPQIALFPSARKILARYFGKAPMYLVTDGHKTVQANKVRALGLEDRFARIFITHRFGLHNAKPSLHCFEMIRKREKCRWQQIVYVADNPAKDFVSLNQVGAVTVRILTGSHCDERVIHRRDARITLHDLRGLPETLRKLK